MLLEEIFLPLTTPFYSDGRLYPRKLEHNVDRYSKTPVAGMVVLGEGGEPSLLSDEESRQTLGTAIDAAAASKVMVAGVFRDSVAATLELAEFAAKAGYDAVVAGVPSVLRDGEREKEMLTYFQAVADRCALPVLLASRSGGAAIGVEALRVLARHPRVLGVVEADGGRVAAVKAATAGVRREVTVTPVFAAVTGRMLEEREPVAGGGSMVSVGSLVGGSVAMAVAPPKAAIKTRSKVVGFQILAAGSMGMLEGLRAGATGVVPGFAACAPQACYEVLAAWKDGDEGLAEEKQIRVRMAAEVVEMGFGVAGVKYGCDLNGYYGGRPRLPLLPLTGEERGEVERLMRGIRN